MIPPALPAEGPESPLEVRPPTPDARCVESPLSALDAPITPTPQFFIRSHFALPEIDLATWRLSVEGEVERPLLLSFDDLAQWPRRELTALLECAGNSRYAVQPRPEGVLWRNGAVGIAEWSGVALRHVLDRAGVRPTASEIVLEGADQGREPGVEHELTYAMSLPLAKALDPDTLLAREMNGAPLAPHHGFPLRAVVPGWYGMASVKWLARIVVVARPFDGHFRTRAYAYIEEGAATDATHPPVTVGRVKSLITHPRAGVPLAAGTHLVRGLAWSGHGRIVRVEVGAGGAGGAGVEERWVPADLYPAVSRYGATHFEVPLALDRPGFYVLRARATDEQGHVQPLVSAWNFRGVGNNSVHAVPIEVRPVPHSSPA